MSLRLILMHVLYRVIFGVGIATLMWVGGQFVYSRTYPLYAGTSIPHHPENTTGVSDTELSNIQLLSRAQPDALRAVPLRRSDAAVPFASHRHKFANELQNMHVGEEIQVVTSEGIFGYVVTTIEIADPSDSRGVEAPGHSQLTLITTSLSSVGSATPQRFIVHARPRREMKN